MITIQLPIEESLLAEIDRAALSSAVTRIDFIRQALETALRKHQIKFYEEQHRKGYERFPVTPDEFDIPESERVWEEP
jgi:metal-responsive CopG/Arc/MetJ family transcriptional regulator